MTYLHHKHNRYHNTCRLDRELSTITKTNNTFRLFMLQSRRRGYSRAPSTSFTTRWRPAEAPTKKWSM